MHAEGIGIKRNCNYAVEVSTRVVSGIHLIQVTHG